MRLPVHRQLTSDAVYSVEDGRVTTHEAAGGPWDCSRQHGAAPAALVAWALESIATPSPMRVARLTLDFLRPVPVAPLSIRTDIVREGRKIQVCAVRLFSDNTEVVRASVLRLRVDDSQSPDRIATLPLNVPGPEAGSEPENPAGIKSLFLEGISMRVARSHPAETASAAMWFRADRRIVSGSPTTPLMRAAIAADFCSGTSAALDFHKWTFVNGDISTNFIRMPRTDWILVDAQSWIGADGSGIAFARLGDEFGYFGRAVQSLIIERR